MFLDFILKVSELKVYKFFRKLKNKNKNRNVIGDILVKLWKRSVFGIDSEKVEDCEYFVFFEEYYIGVDSTVVNEYLSYYCMRK